MTDLTASFGTLYLATKAFVLYNEQKGKNVYVESYDMDEQGFPINAHPLSVREAAALAKVLDTSGDMNRSFLKSKSLLPANVLYVNPGHNGYAVWHTAAQSVSLRFVESLGIPSGNANIPALFWKASKNHLQLYALKGTVSLTEDTPLFHAPFFNVYENGKVCMGTVNIKISADCQLEEFMEKWQRYFFDSYFSHLITTRSPIKGNIVQLWQQLIKTGKNFPEKILTPNGLTLKNLLT
jgi:PRTRC genetic system protein B